MTPHKIRTDLEYDRAMDSCLWWDDPELYWQERRLELAREDQKSGSVPSIRR